LAGICISNVGTTVPHAMGQPISAIAPSVSHGLSLMLVYPPFIIRAADGPVDKLVKVGHLFNPAIKGIWDAVVAISTWIQRFNMPSKLKDVGIKPGNIETLVQQCLMFKKIDQGPMPLKAEDISKMYEEIQ